MTTLRTGRREIGQITVRQIGVFLGVVTGVALVGGTLISFGSDKTNIVRDVAANTKGREVSVTAVKAFDTRLDTAEKDVLKLKTDVVEAIGEMKTTAAELNGKINTVQASLDTLNAHLEHMGK